MASTSQGRKKRRSWNLDEKLHDFTIKEARRMGITDNAALNVLLTELIEWREGKRRFQEPNEARRHG